MFFYLKGAAPLLLGGFAGRNVIFCVVLMVVISVSEFGCDDNARTGGARGGNRCIALPYMVKLVAIGSLRVRHDSGAGVGWLRNGGSYKIGYGFFNRQTFQCFVIVTVVQQRVSVLANLYIYTFIINQRSKFRRCCFTENRTGVVVRRFVLIGGFILLAVFTNSPTCVTKK